MTTQTHAPSARPTTRSARLRRLVAVGSLAPLLALAACSGDDPITAQGRPSTQGGGSTAGTAGAAGSTTTATPSSAPEATATTTPLKVVIKDAELGHTVTATQLVRNVPWPDGSPVGKSSFEIVALEITWKAGSRYSADLRPWMLTLATPETPYAVTTPEFGSLLGTPLVAVARNMERSGWVYFKVDRDSGSKVTLSLHRPDYKISTTGKSLPRKTFTATLAS